MKAEKYFIMPRTATICGIHDDISLLQSAIVIPGLTRNPGFFWLPAPVQDPDPGFAEITRSALINVAMCKSANYDRSRYRRNRQDATAL